MSNNSLLIDLPLSSNLLFQSLNFFVVSFRIFEDWLILNIFDIRLGSSSLERSICVIGKRSAVWLMESSQDIGIGLSSS